MSYHGGVPQRARARPEQHNALCTGGRVYQVFLASANTIQVQPNRLTPTPPPTLEKRPVAVIPFCQVP